MMWETSIPLGEQLALVRETPLSTESPSMKSDTKLPYTAGHLGECAHLKGLCQDIHLEHHVDLRRSREPT